MPITLNGDGAISGLTATGISAAQTVTSANMPAGSVLQVVQGTYGTLVANTTSSFIDTGLTATITPKFSTSKILVLVNQNGIAKDSNNTSLNIILLRGASSITGLSNTAAFTGDSSVNRIGSVSTAFLDSPATTSATTYKTQFSSTQNAANVYVNVDGGSSTSTITLMEIAG
jgi:hypothetical protein